MRWRCEVPIQIRLDARRGRSAPCSEDQGRRNHQLQGGRDVLERLVNLSSFRIFGSFSAPINDSILLVICDFILYIGSYPNSILPRAYCYFRETDHTACLRPDRLRQLEIILVPEAGNDMHFGTRPFRRVLSDLGPTLFLPTTKLFLASCQVMDHMACLTSGQTDWDSLQL